MNTELAKRVMGKEDLRQFLLKHRESAKLGLVTEIEAVSLGQDGRIRLIVFKSEETE